MNKRFLHVLLVLIVSGIPIFSASNVYSASSDRTPFKRWQKYHQPRHLAQNTTIGEANQATSTNSMVPVSALHKSENTDIPQEPFIDSKKIVASPSHDGHDSIKKVQNLKNDATNEERKHVRPAKAVDDPDNKVEVNLEKADLLNVLNWYSSLFNVDFLSGDAFTPPAGGKVQGNVISFHTHEPLTKLKAWDLLLNLLNLFGLTLVPTAYENEHPVSFTVMTSKDANKTALPSFVGTDWKLLPDNDTKIRYVYFIENSTAAILNNIVKDFVSQSAALVPYAPLNALIFTEKSSNIRSIMRIVSELDSVSVPEAMSILRLQHANAEEVAQLYQALVSTEQEGKSNPAIARILGQKKQPSAVYFPPNTRIIAEKRTNSLIVLGTSEGIDKVESFILNHVDTELRQPYSPLYVYELQYANATDMATILNKVTKFAAGSPAATYGGIRDGDKFLRPMSFVADPSGNRLLIKAEKEDYLAVRSIIQELDVLQPQVNIEVLIVNVNTIKNKELGAQLRNKDGGTLGNQVNFQTSGIIGGAQSGIIVNPINGSLLGNLIQLAQGQPIGTTLISIGSDLVGGVWALFKILDTFVHSNVLSHPFLSSTNKYTAQVSLGETRRVQTGTVTGAATSTSVQDDVSANLTIQITPQINSEGMINLDITINVDDFVNANPLSATKTTKSLKTNATVANREILAIGGILRDRFQDTTSKTPLLGNIPLIGWFFKDKNQQQTKDNLLVFISAEIFNPYLGGGMGKLTQQKAVIAQGLSEELTHPSELRDPVFRWFFNDQAAQAQTVIEDYVTHRNPCLDICSIQDNCERVIEYVPSERQATVAPVAPLSSPIPLKKPPMAAKKSSISKFLPEDNEEAAC